MKQYTTPTVTLAVEGKADLLAIADRIVVAVKEQGGAVHLIEGGRLDVDGERIMFTLTEEETSAMRGTCKVEATIFTGELVYKTATALMTIDESVWDND